MEVIEVVYEIIQFFAIIILGLSLMAHAFNDRRHK